MRAQNPYLVNINLTSKALRKGRVITWKTWGSRWINDLMPNYTDYKKGMQLPPSFISCI